MAGKKTGLPEGVDSSPDTQTATSSSAEVVSTVVEDKAKVDKPVKDTSTNVPETAKTEACPYCKPATFWNTRGIKSHIRNNHPEKYDEYIGKSSASQPDEPLAPAKKAIPGLPDDEKTTMLVIIGVALIAITVLFIWLSKKPASEPQPVFLPPSNAEPQPIPDVYLGGTQ
jgi:hypothetical protein